MSSPPAIIPDLSKVILVHPKMPVNTKYRLCSPSQPCHCEEPAIGERRGNLCTRNSKDCISALAMIPWIKLPGNAPPPATQHALHTTHMHPHDALRTKPWSFRAQADRPKSRNLPGKNLTITQNNKSYTSLLAVWYGSPHYPLKAKKRGQHTLPDVQQPEPLLSLAVSNARFKVSFDDIRVINPSQLTWTPFFLAVFP